MMLQRTTKVAGLLSAAVLVGALSGCATDTDPGDDVDPIATVTPGPLESPEPSEPPVDGDDDADDDMDDDESADPVTWEVDDGAVGPIEIGDDFDETLAELGDEWNNDEQCAYMAWWNSPDAGVVIGFTHASDSDDTSIMEVSVEDHTEDGLEPADGPRTESGVGLGSTHDDVMAAYPDATEVPASIGGGFFLKVVVDDDADDGSLFFEFEEGADAVSSMTVTTSDEPAYEACA